MENKVNDNTIINESPNWRTVPKSKEIPYSTLTLGTERKVFIPGLGWQFPTTARRDARAKGDSNWNRIPNPSQPPKKAKPPVVPPVVPPVLPPATQPPATQPPASGQPSGTPAQKPDPKPDPKPVVPPTSVAQTGNRNADLTTWANANKVMINTVGTQQQKDILSAVESGKPLPKAPESIRDQVKNMQRIRMQSESTAYDIVLEYLFSTNQVDTLEEAHYVMMQLDSEYIVNIVEAWRPVSKGAIDKLGGVGNITTGDMLNWARYTTSKGGNKPTSTTLKKRQEAQAKEAGLPPHRGQTGDMNKEYAFAAADANKGNSSGPAAAAMRAGDQKSSPITDYYFKFMSRPKKR